MGCAQGLRKRAAHKDSSFSDLFVVVVVVVVGPRQSDVSQNIWRARQVINGRHVYCTFEQ
jgi:hypothetical protein